MAFQNGGLYFATFDLAIARMLGLEYLPQRNLDFFRLFLIFVVQYYVPTLGYILSLAIILAC